MRVDPRYVGAGAGVLAGLGVAAVARESLPSPERALELEADGIDVMSEREAVAIFAPSAFVAAAAIGIGMSRRSPTAAITTASLGAAAMFASLASSTMVNAGGEKSEDYVRTLVTMVGAGGAGYAVGSSTRVPLVPTKVAGLTLLGLAVGSLLPEAGESLARIPGELRESWAHRHE